MTTPALGGEYDCNFQDGVCDWEKIFYGDDEFGREDESFQDVPRSLVQCDWDGVFAQEFKFQDSLFAKEVRAATLGVQRFGRSAEGRDLRLMLLLDNCGCAS